MWTPYRHSCALSDSSRLKVSPVCCRLAVEALNSPFLPVLFASRTLLERGYIGSAMGNEEYQGIPAGVEVRGSVAKTTTFRVRQGTQERYAYTVSPNPRTEIQQHWRGVFRCAMWAWKALSSEDRQVLEKAATRRHFYSGFLTHMSDYLNGYKAWYGEQ